MGENNNNFGQGRFYINDCEFVGNLTDYNFDDHRADLKDYIKENAFATIDREGALSMTVRFNRISFLKILGIWVWVLENCPNRRVKHLARYGKNEKVRYKNFKRATDLVVNMIEMKGENV